jgi:hypothetical protein
MALNLPAIFYRVVTELALSTRYWNEYDHEPRDIVMKRIVFQVLAATFLGFWALPAAHAAPQDGNWSVLIITEKGDCDRAYRYPISIGEGHVKYAGNTSVAMNGTVAPDGAVRVNIKFGERGANGSGRLNGNSGAGTWHGSGPNASCAGRWEAEKL